MSLLRYTLALQHSKQYVHLAILISLKYFIGQILITTDNNTVVIIKPTRLLTHMQMRISPSSSISDPSHLIKTVRNCWANSYGHSYTRKLKVYILVFILINLTLD